VTTSEGRRGNGAHTPRALFICGSLNQTTQLHAIARKLPEVDASFSPFYGERYVTWMRRLGLLENTIGGHKLRNRCLRYLERNGLAIDVDGERGGYELIVTGTDVVLPYNANGAPIVVVQEGILDPNGVAWPLVSRLPKRVPRWLVGTAATGLSNKYQRFCVASEGYRELFVSRGAPPSRVVSTGIPNFDDCASFKRHDFPERDYVLVCTSDARETYKWHNRKRFIARALHIAGTRKVIFKLHPNENFARARRELERYAPNAKVYIDGPIEAMIANCSTLVTEWSSVAFVGIALGKEVFSSHPMSELRRLLPEQNRSAARRIADVCREVLGLDGVRSAHEMEAAE
jgi:hypothetical protein